MSTPGEERDAPELVRRWSVVVSGAYAWTVTVAQPLSAPGVPSWARASAGVAIVLLALGAVLIRRHALVGRALGLHGFVAASVAAWLLAPGSVGADRLEPTRAALGALGWILFALVWGEPRETGRVPEDDPRALPGDALVARARLPRGAPILLGLSTAGAAVPMALSWRVGRPYHALFAHAVAAAIAVALVTVAADVGIRRQLSRTVDEPAVRLTRAALPLLAFLLAAIVGLTNLLAG